MSDRERDNKGRFLPKKNPKKHQKRLTDAEWELIETYRKEKGV
jgi:hypothetical protein